MTLPEAAAILRVIVRTAASAGTGGGHVARTTAVAGALGRIGADVQWACDEATVPYLLERDISADTIHVLRHAATAGRSGEAEATEAAQVEDAQETLALCAADCTLVDSYQLGAAWQRVARTAGVRVAAFDDLVERPIEADLVINAAASPGAYDALAPSARALTGLPYAITGDPSRPPAAGPGSLLLAFGAADPGNLTEATLRVLAEARDSRRAPVPETVIQLGLGAAGRPQVAQLLSTIAWASFAPAGPTSPGTPTIAIGAAGVGLLERMQAGVPSVVVVAAPNQRALAVAAVRSGAAVAVADVRAACAEAIRLLADPAMRARMAAAGRHAAVLCLGAIIRGETSHDRHIASAVGSGIEQIARARGIPVLFGVLTCDTLAQALARAGGDAGNHYAGNKGRECASAAIEMISLLGRLPS